MCCCPSGNISELMITPSHNITIESGTTVSLNCTAKHTSEQDCSMCLVWKHEDRVLSDERLMKITNTKSLSLIISARSQGNYTCQRREMPFQAKSVNITLASKDLLILSLLLLAPTISVAVSIKGTYTNIRIGNATNITCMIVPLPLSTSYKWLSQNGMVLNKSNVLILTGSQVINGSNFTCIVNSSQLYYPIKKNITFTVLGKITTPHC